MTDTAVFIDCPQCHGYGFTRTGAGKPVQCSHCTAEHSMYGFVDNDILYWSKPLSSTTVQQQHILRWLEQVVVGIILLIILIGGLGFAWYATVLAPHLNPLNHVFAQRSIFVSGFWLALAATGFLYYRLIHDQRIVKPITKSNYLAKLTITGEVNDWTYWRNLSDRYKIAVSDHLDDASQLALERAYTLAHQHKHSEVLPLHLFQALRKDSAVAEVLWRSELDLRVIFSALDQMQDRLPAHTDNLVPVTGASLRQTVLDAYSEARLQQRPTIRPVELLIGCLMSDQTLYDVLYERGFELTKVRQLVQWNNLVHDQIIAFRRRRHLSHSKPKTIMNRAMTARPTAQLDAISQDFTLMARAGMFLPVIGRTHEVQEAFRVLREGHSSVLFVGESGGGKSTLLQGIAQLMTAEDVPVALQDKRFVVTEPGALIAGAGGVGGLEQRIEKVIGEIIKAGNVIWGIEDIHTLLGAGSTGSSIDIGKILMNYISQGYIKVVGTTTTAEFQKYIEHNEPFLRRFQVVHVPELSAADAILVLAGRAPIYETKYRVWFTYDAVVACVQLSERFIKDRHLPAKALDIMEEAAIYTRDQFGEHAQVHHGIIEQIMSEKTNVTLTALSTDETDKLLHLEDHLAKRVIGQTEAITAIARALRRAREDIRDLTRPIASLLFLGPTGVGKTETAKALAGIYFGNDRALMRFDMSEYDTPDSLVKLIGAPEQPGHLTEAVRRTPFGIILLDELEKAHPDVLNVFLQVMEDGRLTDGLGQTADFTNTIIIATSNAGTADIQQLYDAGESPEAIQETLINGQLLHTIFKPEFLNRFDHIAVFTPFTPEELVQVCALMLGTFAKAMETKGIHVQWTDAALVDLVKHGYNRQFGARPLRRLLQDHVQDEIAKLLLSKQLQRRDIVEIRGTDQVVLVKAKPL